MLINNTNLSKTFFENCFNSLIVNDYFSLLIILKLQSLPLLHRMPHYRLQLFRCGFSWVGEVDFVVEAGGGEVVDVAGGGDEVVHKFHGFRLLIVSADVHYLYTETFVDGEKLGSRTVNLFLFGGC